MYMCPVSNKTDTKFGELRPRLVTVREACRLLGIGKSRIYELATDGRIKKVRLDGRALITVDSIDCLVDSVIRASVQEIDCNE
jgi:excisionase family DNA binding protein